MMIVQPSNSRVNSVRELYCCWLLSCQCTGLLVCGRTQKAAFRCNYS